MQHLGSSHQTFLITPENTNILIHFAYIFSGKKSFFLSLCVSPDTRHLVSVSGNIVKKQKHYCKAKVLSLYNFTQFFNPKTGPADVVRFTFLEGGLLAFYKGYVPAFVRLGPHTVLTFVFFEQLKKNFGYVKEAT
jgi:hypothetical protein